MTEEEKKTLKNEILDAYFNLRRNLPEDGAIPDNKTTQDIIDELENMVRLNETDVMDYLQRNDYHLTTDGDGSVKWAIWRLA